MTTNPKAASTSRNRFRGAMRTSSSKKLIGRSIVNDCWTNPTRQRGIPRRGAGLVVSGDLVAIGYPVRRPGQRRHADVDVRFFRFDRDGIQFFGQGIDLVVKGIQ